MNISRTLLAGSAIFIGINIFSQKKVEKYEKLDISMYPKAKTGDKQVYIQLPVEKNEDALKVEFFVGTEKMLDCNNYSLAGQMKEQDLQGWGYKYYEVESKGETIGTLMGCGDQKKTKKFVSLLPQLVRYNSKAPLVFYIPKDLEVRYRILCADSAMKKAIEK